MTALNISQARAYVLRHGTLGEQVRLRAMESSVATPDDWALVMADQRPDGGFAPLWARGYSSIDATCFHLAQARVLDPRSAHPSATRALDFLAARQAPDGAFSESESVADRAPPWARPGDAAARCYLTANAALCLSLAGRQYPVARAAAVLDRDLARTPAVSMVAQWLAAALFWRRGSHEAAERVLRALGPRLPDLSGGALAWLLATLLESGLPSLNPVVQQAWELLLAVQRPDGAFESDDGEPFLVQATLEALRARRLMETADGPVDTPPLP